MALTMPNEYELDQGDPAPGTVPVTVVVLTKNEEANITRCLESAAWAAQRVVVDSGSTDATVAMARAAGAEVLETTWHGWGLQREWALRRPEILYDWVYFLDADEWVSADLASEIAQALRVPSPCVAYRQRFRLVFQGRWIRHCGWYPSVYVTRLLRRDKTRYVSSTFSEGEHPEIDGRVGTLSSDLVDDDAKGLARWLVKHVSYAELEVDRRLAAKDRSTRDLPPSTRMNDLAKRRIAPRIPFRPAAQFIYMYLLRLGFLDGRQGLLFCFQHFWFQVSVKAMERERRLRNSGGGDSIQASRSL